MILYPKPWQPFRVLCKYILAMHALGGDDVGIHSSQFISVRIDFLEIGIHELVQFPCNIARTG